MQPTADYSARFKATQEMIANLTPDRQILADKQIGRANFVVLNENILAANTDVVVSSDDNHFTARGGVAKAILDKLGPEAQKELAHFRRNRFRQGQLAITTGGNWGRRAVIHPAVIDLDENRYPTVETIRRLTRQSLICAAALGANSIAFPVLGGGTASKYLKPEDSVKALAEEVLAFLRAQSLDYEVLTHVELYIFNPEDAKGLPSELLDSQNPGVSEQAAQPGHVINRPPAGS